MYWGKYDKNVQYTSSGFRGKGLKLEEVFFITDKMLFGTIFEKWKLKLNQTI
jgi:hypothetical protein